MLKWLFRRFEIDHAQWLALTRIFIRKDFRESTMSATLRHGRTGGRTYFTLLFFYFITGLVFIPIVLTAQSTAVSMTLLISYTMFMIGGLILVEYHTVVISPEDYTVLGYQPMSAQTFFVVKLTNILFYVLTFSTVLALPGLVALMFAVGFRPTLGVVAFGCVLLANFTTTLAIVLLYTLILKKVSVHRLQNFLALLQVGLAFLIYSSFLILPRILESGRLRSLEVSNTKWLLLLPSTWFASLIEVLAGQPTSLDLALAALAISATALLLYISTSRLTLDYSEKLAMLNSELNLKHRPRRRFVNPFLMFAHAHEERVVSKLIRNQFLHDNKFKMAVLGILPLTIFYLFVGIEEGPLPDPFLDPEFEFKRTGLLYLLVFLFPMMLRTYVTQSDSFQASWIFYATPTNIQRIVISEKNFLMIYFVLPFLLILGGIFFYYFDTLLHVLLHVLVLGLLAHLFLQFAFLYSPDLPFSRPNVKGSRSKNIALFLILVPFIIYLILPLIFEYVYSNAVSFLTFTIMILTISLILETLIQVRVSVYMKKYEFSG